MAALRKHRVSHVSYNIERMQNEAVSIQSQTEFITEHFCRKECVCFVPKKDDKKSKEGNTGKQKISLCCCGESINKHINNISGPADAYLHGDSANDNNLTSGKQSVEWNIKMHVEELPTNAYGFINFGTENSTKPSKYVRLADNTDSNKVIQFFKDHWHMLEPTKPSLVITVIGGAKNFELDRKKKEIFIRGLDSAAKSTNAWIITSGFNMGVMKAVGDAVAVGQTFNWDKLETGITHQLRCIGIAPWGYVEHRAWLECENRDSNIPVNYTVSNTIRHGQPVSLNPNHTHFLLVDDGVRGKYQGVAGFRAKLEKKISQPADDGGLGIPVVLVLLEGGYDAIDDVTTSLASNIPVVLCEGTGRAADILAYASTHIVRERNKEPTKENQRYLRPEHKSILRHKLELAFGETWLERGGEENLTKNLNFYENKVIQCCQDDRYVSVIDMNKHGDLDVAILSALLKAQGTANEHQLELALTWNRSDVAEDKIFNQDINSDDGFNKLMTRAIVEDKVNFVRLFLQNGVNINEFLTAKKLKELYNGVLRSSACRQLLLRLGYIKPTESFCLQHIGKLVRSLIGRLGKDLYTSVDQSTKFDRPFNELLIWAILMNRLAMAKFFWERAEDLIASALVASLMFGTMANKMAHYESDSIVSFKQNKIEFERLAIKVLDECHRTHPEYAIKLVEKKNEKWSAMSCLDIAGEAKDKAFMSTVCCQNSLNQLWLKGIQSHWILVLLALVFPPLILKPMKFQSKFDSRPDGENKQQSPLPKLSACEKLAIFYRAPITKFSANLVMYFLFLVLYSYVILFEFHDYITPYEWVVLAWIFSMLVDELRDMLCSSGADHLIDRVYEWWKFSIFNRMDLVIFIIAIIGFVLRFFPDHLVAAKTVYCINCVLFFVRILRDYSANSNLGPKLVMILTMLEELVVFLLIFVIIIIAFGVTSQSMMYIQREPYALIFRDIFYYPYWSLFGQLFLDEMQGLTDSCLQPNGTLSTGEPCPSSNWLVYVLTALYLLIANILLLNILIAIFNHVFQDIQANSIEIWKFGIYFLVTEYDKKPGLAPPFIIFEHLFLIFRWMWRKLSDCCANSQEEKGLYDKDVALSALEKECCRHLLQKEKMSESENIQKKIKFIECRVDDVFKILEEDRQLAERKQDEPEVLLTPRHRSPLNSTARSNFPQATNTDVLTVDATSIEKLSLKIQMLSDKIDNTHSHKKKAAIQSASDNEEMPVKSQNIPQIEVVDADENEVFESVKSNRKHRRHRSSKRRTLEKTRDSSRQDTRDEETLADTDSPSHVIAWGSGAVPGSATSNPAGGDSRIANKVAALNIYLSGIGDRMLVVEGQLTRLEQSMFGLENFLRSALHGPDSSGQPFRSLSMHGHRRRNAQHSDDRFGDENV